MRRRFSRFFRFRWFAGSAAAWSAWFGCRTAAAAAAAAAPAIMPVFYACLLPEQQFLQLKLHFDMAQAAGRGQTNMDSARAMTGSVQAVPKFAQTKL